MQRVIWLHFVFTVAHPRCGRTASLLPCLSERRRPTSATLLPYCEEVELSEGGGKKQVAVAAAFCSESNSSVKLNLDAAQDVNE